MRFDGGVLITSTDFSFTLSGTVLALEFRGHPSVGLDVNIKSGSMLNGTSDFLGHCKFLTVKQNSEEYAKFSSNTII